MIEPPSVSHRLDSVAQSRIEAILGVFEGAWQAARTSGKDAPVIEDFLVGPTPSAWSCGKNWCSPTSKIA